MTNKKLTQSEQDAITLDFDKWSFQQRQLKLDNSHSLWLQEKERTLARWQAENNQTRQNYLARLNDEREAKRQKQMRG